MLYERHFECKTRGLVQGPSVLDGFPAAVTSIRTPKQFRFLNKREFFVEDFFKDLREEQQQPWIRTYKIVIRSRESKEEIWVRPFADKSDCFLIWARLIGMDLERLPTDRPFVCPTVWIDGDLEYIFATVDQFTTVGSFTWSPTGTVSQVDYLIVAGGASGGGSPSGSYGAAAGGGAGELKTANNYTFSTKSVTVGNYGAGSASASNGNAGADSIFDGITSKGGGYGSKGYGAGGNTSASGGTSACGGGASGSGNAGGAGTKYTGGAASSSSDNAGGGAGDSQNGQAGTSSVGGAGGNGTSSSLTGSSVAYSGGGGGGAYGSFTVGAAGNAAATAGAGNGGNSSAATANRGGGSGGGGGTGSGAGATSSGNGGTGFVALSYTPLANVFRNMPMLGM